MSVTGAPRTQGLFARVQNILLRPRAEWEVIAGESATFDRDALAEYRSTSAALGPSAAAVAADALALVTEAENIAATNVSPATVLGWLQIQLRSVALARTPDAARR